MFQQNRLFRAQRWAHNTRTMNYYGETSRCLHHESPSFCNKYWLLRLKLPFTSFSRKCELNDRHRDKENKGWSHLVHLFAGMIPLQNREWCPENGGVSLDAKPGALFQSFSCYGCAKVFKAFLGIDDYWLDENEGNEDAPLVLWPDKTFPNPHSAFVVKQFSKTYCCLKFVSISKGIPQWHERFYCIGVDSLLPLVCGATGEMIMKLLINYHFASMGVIA